MPSAGQGARDSVKPRRVTAIDPRLMLQGYAMGIFPMADSRTADEVFWVEPRSRAVIPIDHFHLSHSLRRTLRSGKFRVSLDTAFADVLESCADREETWINADIERAMIALHRLGQTGALEFPPEPGGAAQANDPRRLQVRPGKFNVHTC